MWERRRRAKQTKQAGFSPQVHLYELFMEIRRRAWGSIWSFRGNRAFTVDGFNWTERRDMLDWARRPWTYWTTNGCSFQHSLGLTICGNSNIYITVQGLARPSSNHLARGRKHIQNYNYEMIYLEACLRQETRTRHAYPPNTLLLCSVESDTCKPSRGVLNHHKKRFGLRG